MTGAVDVTEDLAEWARRASYEVNQRSQALLHDDVENDGRTIIWANHWRAQSAGARHSYLNPSGQPLFTVGEVFP